MTKPTVEVALLRLFKAAARGDCTAPEAFECFMLGYGGSYIPSPRGLKAECARIPALKSEIRDTFLKLTLDE